MEGGTLPKLRIQHLRNISAVDAGKRQLHAEDAEEHDNELSRWEWEISVGRNTSTTESFS